MLQLVYKVVYEFLIKFLARVRGWLKIHRGVRFTGGYMKNNKGFSLIEIIIVVAIMAILVGVIFPFFIMYLNKSKVSSDFQFCDSIQAAIEIAMNDPDVLNSTDGSSTQINDIKSGNVVQIDLLTDSLFVDTVNEIMGYDVCSLANNRDHYRTRTAKTAGELKIQYYNGSFYVWIDGSDSTGKDAVAYTVADASSMSDNSVIYVK